MENKSTGITARMFSGRITQKQRRARSSRDTLAKDLMTPEEYDAVRRAIFFRRGVF